MTTHLVAGASSPRGRRLVERIQREGHHAVTLDARLRAGAAPPAAGAPGEALRITEPLDFVWDLATWEADDALATAAPLLDVAHAHDARFILLSTDAGGRAESLAEEYRTRIGIDTSIARVRADRAWEHDLDAEVDALWRLARGGGAGPLDITRGRRARSPLTFAWHALGRVLPRTA